MTSLHLGIFGDDPDGAIEEAASWGMDRLMVPAYLYIGDPADKLAPLAEVIARHG
ncbi:MAG: hypothetical protein R2695_02435 [Acidimicrobiales bacterium]